MLQKIPFKLAFWFALTLSVLANIFHILVLVEIIPFNVVWGGRLANREEMMVFESVSLLVNTLVIFFILLLEKFPQNKFLHVFMYFLAGVFALNTVGNLFATTLLEKLIATPLTLVASIMFARLGKGA